MDNVKIEIPATPVVAYPVLLGEGLLSQPKRWFPKEKQHKPLVIITDDTVQALYGRALCAALKSIAEPVVISFPSGETSKETQTKLWVEEQMIDYRCNRETTILALGGGVVGDMAGFVAATYMRGIDYIQIPTTLLAMIDSSVGGKTGINVNSVKNAVGCFWQPRTVIMDLDCLKTLDKTHWINGLIEAIKLFITCDAENFYWTSEHLDELLTTAGSKLQQLIKQAVTWKSQIVMQDEKENGLRMILNLGHTVGHAIEQVTQFNILHGYAVALGILVETKLAQLLKISSESDYQTIKMLFLRLGISGEMIAALDKEALISAMYTDKKAKSGQIQCVLISEIGKIHQNKTQYTCSVTEALLREALDAASEM